MTSSHQQRIYGKYFGKKLKAREVIKLYKAGERNFQGAILKGQLFKGQNLSEADFSETDIRGTSFTNANLRKCKFCDAKAGLQDHWVAILLIFSSLLGTVVGVAVGVVLGIVTTF